MLALTLSLIRLLCLHAAPDDSGWILLDYGDILVHIMTPKSRAYYDLDSFFVAANPVNLAKRTRWISMWVENGKRRAKMRAFFNELTYQPSESQRIDARGKPRHLPGNRILVQHAL